MFLYFTGSRKKTPTPVQHEPLWKHTFWSNFFLTMIDVFKYYLKYFDFYVTWLVHNKVLTLDFISK